MSRTNSGINVFNPSDGIPSDATGGGAGGDSTAAAIAMARDQASQAQATIQNLQGSATTLPYGTNPTVTVTGSGTSKVINVGIPLGMPEDVGGLLVADAQAAQTSAAQSAADAGASRVLAEQAQAAALEVPDANVSALLGNPVTDARAAAETALNSGATLERFGATGSGDDGAAISSALTWAIANGGKIAGRPGRVYTISSPVVVPVAADARTSIDFGGATLRFTGGASLWLGVQNPTPYLTTTTTAGVTRRGTSFTVASATGVAIGDLVTITSPVEWVAGIPLAQTHVVSDVDGTTIYVEGRVPGDITPAQVTTAGLTGDLVVKFYHPADRVELRNATIDSPAKDGADNLVNIAGVRRVLLDNVHVKRPKRTGVNVTMSGTVEFVGCSTSEHGYTNKDRGYASLAGDPGGLAFGYGFLTSNCYSVQHRGCNSYSGWHGFDVARGVSYALWDGCVTHKDAYGYSTHEGAWVMEVRNSESIGGNGIACRASELLVIGGNYATSLGGAISGHMTLQNLVLKDVTIDCAQVSGAAAPFTFTSTTYPAACASAEPPTAILDGVLMTNVTAAPTITTRGDVTLRNVTLTGRPDLTTGDSLVKCYTTGTGKTLTLDNVNMTGPSGQFCFQGEGFDKIDMVNSNQRGTARIPTNGALLYVTGANAPTVRVEQCSATGQEYIVRVNGPTATVSTISCTAKYMIFGGAAVTAKAVAACRTQTATLVVGGVAAPTTSVGNVVVPA